MKFFVGLHQPADARHFKTACVSINRLRGRKKPIENCNVLIDSGAFTEISRYGHYRSSVFEYASELYRLHTQGIVKIVAAVAQDYMCEPFILKKTGLSVAEHQRLTIERYDRLVECLDFMFAGSIPFPVMPVLQGYDPAEYVSHLIQYGNRLKPGMWTGVGSVCKRNARPESIVAVVNAVKLLRPDLALHGFGVKTTALKNPIIRDAFESTDSMAWSTYHRFVTGRQNDWRAAREFEQRIKQICTPDLFGPLY